MTFETIEEAKEAEEEMSKILDSVEEDLYDIGVRTCGYLKSSLSVPEVWGEISFQAASDILLVVDVDESMKLKYPNLTKLGKMNSVSFESKEELIRFLEKYFT